MNLNEYWEKIPVGIDECLASDNAEEMAYYIEKHPNYYRLAVFELDKYESNKENFNLYLLSDIDICIHYDLTISAVNNGYLREKDKNKFYLCYVLPIEEFEDKDDFYLTIADHMGRETYCYIYKNFVLVYINYKEIGFENTIFLNALGKPQSVKKILIDEDEDTGELINTLDETLLNEMKGKEKITDKRVLDLINDCIDNLFKINYQIDNDISFYYGTALGQLGTLISPKRPYDNYQLVLNKELLKESDDDIQNTIYHELAHYIVIKDLFNEGVLYWDDYKLFIRRSLYNKADHSSHGNYWLKVANDISTRLKLPKKITVTNSNKSMNNYYDSNVHYIVRCKKCGQEYKFNRKTKFVQDPNALSSYGNFYKWQCGTCGAKGEFEVLEVNK